MAGRERSRSRDGSEEEECTPEMVEEKLQKLEAEGLLENNELDAGAKAMLRKSDPDIAMEALKQWESSEMWTRNNPSACMTKLLKRLNAQGHEVAARNRGAVDTDEAAKESVQELLEQLSDKLDHSAREEIEKLPVHQALNILSDIDSQADAIRNPSAFVMAAARRQGSAGSRSRRDPPRLQEGPYADRSSYNDRGYADRDSYDNHRRDSDRSNGYGRQDYNSYSQNNGYAESHYQRRRDDKSYHQGYGRSEHENQKVEQLLQYLDIDESAKEALSTIPVESQVELLEELTEDYSRVRNHSAFIVSNVKRVKDGTYRSRAPKDNGDGYSHNDFREYNSRRDHDRHYDYTSYQEEAEVANSPQDSFAWSALDEKAQALILGLSSEDQATMIDDLEKKFHNLRNPSAFVASVVTKRYPRSGGQDTSSYDPPARSRSPRGHRQAIGASTEGYRPSSKQTAQYQDSRYEANDQSLAPRSAEEAEQQRLQVADFLKNGLQDDIVLDNKAKDEMLRIPPHEAISLMLKLTANDIRNPSAFVTKACREILKHVDSDPYAKQAANGHDAEGPGSNERSQSRRPSARKQAAYGDNAAASSEWRSLPLDEWLRSVDHGKGFLLQYEQALQSNYDTLEQIMDLYVTTGDDGKATIDQQFFSDLSVEKVGHKRLFEKWFNEHRDELL